MDTDLTEEELRDIIANRARRFANTYERAADSYPFELEVQSVTSPLRELENENFEDVVQQEKQTLRAVAMIREIVNQQFWALNIESRTAHDKLPWKEEIVELFRDVRKVLDVDKQQRLVTFKQLQDRASEYMEGGEPIRVRYACAPIVGDYYIDNLNETAHEGKLKIVQENEVGDGRYESDVLQTPTWGDLALEANQIIKRFGYETSIFFEGYTPRSSEDSEDDFPDDIRVVNLSFGS